jgi:hypothetical protein
MRATSTEFLRSIVRTIAQRFSGGQPDPLWVICFQPKFGVGEPGIDHCAVDYDLCTLLARPMLLYALGAIIPLCKQQG